MTEEPVVPDAIDRSDVIARLKSDLAVDDARIEQLNCFVSMLLLEAQQQNLIASATQPLIWSRHILDSAQLLFHVPRGTSRSWIDLGSGAGLPGIVLAILRPADNFTLVERRPLRIAWLQKVKDELALSNVHIEGAPVSSLNTKKFDVITARAFAPMPKVLALANRFATKNTLWLLPKGRSASDELSAIPALQTMFHVEPSVTDSESGILVGRIDPAKIDERGGVRR